MGATKVGLEKVAAKKLGLSRDEYLVRLAAGLKHCRKCRQWKAVAEFGTDLSRYDRLTTACHGCRRTGTRPGPSRRERLAKKAAGLGWCRECAAWVPILTRRGGRCPNCENAHLRRKYATNDTYRRRVKGRVKRRKRGVDPVPLEGVELMQLFAGLCAYCDRQAQVFDHVHPVVKGGKTTPNNILPACRSCNSRKHDKDLYEWVDSNGIALRPEVVERLCFIENGMLC